VNADMVSVIGISGGSSSTAYKGLPGY